MKRYIHTLFYISALALAVSCADNSLEVSPEDENYPLRLLLDAEEGADLPDAEDFDLEIKFADYIGSLPARTIQVDYEISDLEGDMDGVVTIDKIVYEYEDDDCVFEREIPFTSTNGLTGTIEIPVDADLGTVPPSFEVVFTLPGNDDTEGSFSFTVKNIRSSDQVILGAPLTFEYEVLDSDIAGEWELELETEEAFEDFKKVFGPLHPELDALSFSDITGSVKAEFEFEEINLVIELAEEEEVTTCEDGETETETKNKELELEAEYDADDGELSFEGSHFIMGDDGEINDELDFEIESDYEINDDALTITFKKVVDEDNYAEGEELFRSEGVSFTFKKD